MDTGMETKAIITRATILLLVIIVIPFLDQGAAFARAEWELVKDKKALKIYARKTRGFAGKYFSNMGSKRTIFRSLENLRIVAEEPKYKELGKQLRETYTHK